MLLIALASISLKIKIFENICTKSFEILCKKSVLLSCLVILSLGLKIEHSYWNCTEFFITLKQPMSEMLGKITFFLLIWNLKILGVQQESKTLAPMMLFDLGNKLLLFVDHYQTPCMWQTQLYCYAVQLNCTLVLKIMAPGLEGKLNMTNESFNFVLVLV